MPNSAKRGDVLALLRDVSGFFMPGEMSALVRARQHPRQHMPDITSRMQTRGPKR